MIFVEIVWWKVILVIIGAGIIIEYVIPLLFGLISISIVAIISVIMYLWKKVIGSINGKFISKKN
jgi:hypothetical protein